MSRLESKPPMPDWVPEPRPWCPECCVPANACGCRTGERIHLEAMEAHIIRGSE